MNTLEEIKKICLSNEIKANKVKKLVSDFGYTKKIAEREIEYMLFFARMSKLQTNNSSIKFTFGVEIECYNVDRRLLVDLLREKGVIIRTESYNHTDHKDGVYKMVTDGSICGYNAVEVVTPVLEDFESLKKVCDALALAGAKVNKTCGLHVHIGMNGHSARSISRIVKNYFQCEPVIDSFMPASRRNNEYCQPLPASVIESDVAFFDDFEYMLDSRYYKVNLYAYERHETIEFRQHSGTIDFEKIKNWIEFLSGLCSFSIQNEKVLDKRCESLDDIQFISEDIKTYYRERQRKFNN